MREKYRSYKNKVTTQLEFAKQPTNEEKFEGGGGNPSKNDTKLRDGILKKETSDSFSPGPSVSKIFNFRWNDGEKLPWNNFYNSSGGDRAFKGSQFHHWSCSFEILDENDKHHKKVSFMRASSMKCWIGENR